MSTLESAIRALPMDEPPADSTVAAAAALALRTASLEDCHAGEARTLMATMTACLDAMARRQLLFVYGVPHLTAAAYLIESGEQSETALRGLRYELATLLPPATRSSDAAPPEIAPDVSVDSLKTRR